MENNNSVFKITKNLTITCFIAGVIIALVYYITAPVAAQKQIELKNKTMQSLVKNADDFKSVSGKTDWYEAKQGSNTVAYVLPAESKGYGGAITMLVAVTPDGKVIGFSILSHNETPGLGANASKDSFTSQFKGKTAEDLLVVKDKSNHKNIQAMTGATITSRAVTKGVKEAVEKVTTFTGGK
ncbi:RnfABCDGE type electron transport complex subunit G [Clostridium kluyveri]|uniref:Ion-translocating oxidoreductase complex subunit G n=1 Tax=Clostridium kluyveri TaxID=1534 RepID=A0A1L5F6M2_CLOKL|nr:RnfABCDGE type electron transport complex subunit G [Clostridium kluyveri]APM38644.1 RnfABCDGE type electron transport complex subunit G [Clostridium kluyveri]UZQ50959.1 RnfABCDGE type electron transport complex subunit G [Clostridium kluyveri]